MIGNNSVVSEWKENFRLSQPNPSLFWRYFVSRCRGNKQLRSGKILALERSDKQHNYSKALNLSKSNMAATELLEELKSMRLDLTGQITKLSDDLKDFQRNTNERLQKIESVMSKADEIDGLKTKQQQLETDVDNIKESQLNLKK